MKADLRSKGAARRIDLNLVRVFVAIYETRSVSQAAVRLCVAQPTVSYGLAAVRRVLQDSLFVRTREGMMPTVRAHQVYQEFTAALARIDDVVQDSQNFIAADSHRRFLIAMSDIGEMIFLPPILELLARQAPHVQIEVVDAATPDLRRRLATGEVSAVVGNLPSLLRDTQSQPLLEERYVCLLRKKHGFIGRKLTLNGFNAASHVWVTSGFSGHNQIEDTLQRHGIKRRIALQIPHFAILPRLIATSDLLVVIPLRVARLFATYEPVRWLDIPLPVPDFQVRLHWHAHDDQNRANKWLRSVVIDSLTGI